MRRPHPAGRALEAVTPLMEKLTALEANALQGRSLSVVALAAELAATCAAVARDAMALILEQAALGSFEEATFGSAPRAIEPRSTWGRRNCPSLRCWLAVFLCHHFYEPKPLLIETSASTNSCKF